MFWSVPLEQQLAIIICQGRRWPLERERDSILSAFRSALMQIPNVVAQYSGASHELCSLRRGTYPEAGTCQRSGLVREIGTKKMYMEGIVGT